MRYGAQLVVRTLAKRVTVFLLVLGCLTLAGDPRGAGVQAGLLLAAALVCHAVAFGVGPTTKAAPLGALRMAAAAGVLAAACAGVWAARAEAFNFIIAPLGALNVSPGGALVHLAAALAVAGAGAFIFLCLAGRATALGDDR